MKIKRKQAISIAAVILLLVVGYMLFSPRGGSETVIIGQDGLVRKEKYIAGAETCTRSGEAPSWCGEEYGVAYSSGAANELDTSFFNPETGMCSDGTKDCVYTERYNSDRILQGIFNSKGEELGQKFFDDLYAGKITLSSDTMERYKKTSKFENGIFKMKNRDTWYTVKVGLVSDEQIREEGRQGIMRLPISMFILILGVYFKANNLPKPTLSYKMHSPMNLAQYRASLPPPSSPTGPISRPPEASLPPSA